MQICNAYRYCEGFCAVFPAMERRRTFSTGDAAYLANLCHHCGAVIMLQYAPPHEFGVNVPQALATLRKTAISLMPGRASCRIVPPQWAGGGVCADAGSGAGHRGDAGADIAASVLGVHLGEGAFYVLMPHYVMAGIPGFITAFSVLA